MATNDAAASAEVVTVTVADDEQELDERAMSVACPKCDAAPDEACMSPAGRSRRPHQQRREAEKTTPAGMGTVGLVDAEGVARPREVTGARVLRIPLGSGAGRAAGYVDFRPTPRQRVGLRALFDGVRGRAVLETGRIVRKQSHALRWLLEQLADAAEAGCEAVEVEVAL